MADTVVRDAIPALSTIDWRILVVVSLGVAGDDVPGVNQSGKIAEHAEEDIDDTVGTAEAAFDPYYRMSEQSEVGHRVVVRLTCDRREEDGNQAEEDVCARHSGWFG